MKIFEDDFDDVLEEEVEEEFDNEFEETDDAESDENSFKGQVESFSQDELVEEAECGWESSAEVIKISYDIEEPEATTFYSLILKKFDNSIKFIARFGCDQFDDEDLSHAVTSEEWFEDEKYLQLFDLLANECDSSFDEGYPVYVSVDNGSGVAVTPKMMAIVNVFVKEACGFDYYGTEIRKMAVEKFGPYDGGAYMDQLLRYNQPAKTAYDTILENCSLDSDCDW